MIELYTMFIKTNHEANLRQELGWGGVEVCHPVLPNARGIHHKVRVQERRRAKLFPQTCSQRFQRLQELSLLI